MTEPAPKGRVSREEYLAFERASQERHQLWDGEVFAMSGASRKHERIVRNLIWRLSERLEGKPCEPFPSNMRIRIPATERYVYGDVTVACDATFEDEELDTLTNPRIVIEVLSDSTEKFDRVAKFEGYRSIPSLLEYVLVAQDRRAIDHYRRQPDGKWLLTPLLDEGELVLDSVRCTLPLREVYFGVFEEPEPSPGT